jgi:NAD(P)-dependent dehydrogenase (short-subunit alcohol dehydrogenase family)
LLVLEFIASSIGQARSKLNGLTKSLVAPTDYHGKSTHDSINFYFPHSRAVYVKTDAGDSESVANVVAECVKTFGRLDIMVNNAGVALEASHPRALRIHETPDETYDQTMKVNSRGVWLGCKYATKQMLEQEPHTSGDRGWIINMSSTLGLVGLGGVSSYCASKGSTVQIVGFSAGPSCECIMKADPSAPDQTSRR